MDKKENRIDYTKIFGTYVMNTRTLPGYDASEDRKNKERQKLLMELVDEYCESA